MKPRRLIEFENSDAEKVEQLEGTLHDATTALFEIKKLLTKGGTLLEFFDDVEKLVTAEPVRAALHWRRDNTVRLKKKAKVQSTLLIPEMGQPEMLRPADQIYFQATERDVTRMPVLFKDGKRVMCSVIKIEGTKLKGIVVGTGQMVQLQNLIIGQNDDFISIQQGHLSSVPKGRLIEVYPAPKQYTGQRAWGRLNFGCQTQPKTAGFWRESIEKSTELGGSLPFPVRMKLETFEKEAFLKQLAIEERRATKRNMKGWSTNRWDGSKNGSAEFQYKGWRWPSGYKTYLEGGVLPSASFFKFIMGYELPGLPAL
jgi:hypothetical protein